jgi:hypothetical protein
VAPKELAQHRVLDLAPAKAAVVVDLLEVLALRLVEAVADRIRAAPVVALVVSLPVLVVWVETKIGQQAVAALLEA